VIKIASGFYKYNFSFEDRPDIEFKYDLFSHEEKVSIEKKKMLGRAFTGVKVKEAMFGSNADGALGPDGLSFNVL
jgi:hypothetical protein